jgi:hypothetical protein
VPRKVHQAIELIATGRVKTIKAAAERVGYARETLSKKLSQPECVAAMKARAAKEVALGSGRAAARLNELMESPSAKVSMEATKFSLQAAGIGPATAAPVNVNVEMRAGYVIDLRPRNYDGPAARAVIPGAGAVIDVKPKPIADVPIIEAEAEPSADFEPVPKLDGD